MQRESIIEGGNRDSSSLTLRQDRLGWSQGGYVIAGSPWLLSDGSLLYLAVADVLVDGQRLEGVGVEPDILVRFDQRYAAGSDPQLDRAIAVAVAAVNDLQE